MKPDYKFCVYFVLAVCINILVSLPLFSENYIVNGLLCEEPQLADIKNSIVRRESLVVKDGRVYIKIMLDEGARNITNHKRYKEILYLLPKEVVYDDISKCIFCYMENKEYEIGRIKHFLGFMPYIALTEFVRIASSPTDAKLLISTENVNIQKTAVHSDEGMEITLGRRCGQCHILEYIYSHKNWLEEDILHAYNRLQMDKEERFTKDEQKIIDLFKSYQKGEIDKGRLAEFKSLKQMGEKDVADFTEGVYMDNCVPCHNPARMKDVSLLYSKRRCKSVADRIKEKEPSLFLQADMDRLASYLWEIKLKPYSN